MVPELTREELALATRNHGMPLEALRYDVTPAGLHYLLTHYDIPDVDAASWEVGLGGRVRHPRTLTLEDLRALPPVTRWVTMECAGNGRARLDPRPISQPWLYEAVGTAEWTGVPLATLLDAAGVLDDAVEVVFTGLDRGIERDAEQHYARSLALADALAPDVIVAYAMNGAPLLPQHGAPARLLVPGWYGMASVKWLASIEVVAEPFAGDQQARSYRLRQEPDEEGEPLRLIAVRALMVPPGIPDFPGRHRVVDLATTTITGRAWSGSGPVVTVQVSDDGGRAWSLAQLDDRPAEHAWQRWTWAWTPAAPGEYELTCRATDAGGATQPLEPEWNLGGYGVNAVQRVPVTVRG